MSASAVTVCCGANRWSVPRGKFAECFPYFIETLEDKDASELTLPASLSPEVFDVLVEFTRRLENGPVEPLTCRTVHCKNFLAILCHVTFLLAAQTFDGILASLVDAGKIFFPQSRRLLALDETHGSAFAECSQYLWLNEYFPRLKRSFLTLLVWISQRAIESPWFDLLPYQMFVDLADQAHPRRFGLESDVNCLILAECLVRRREIDLEKLLFLLGRLRSERRNFPERTAQFYWKLLETVSNAQAVREDDASSFQRRLFDAVFPGNIPASIDGNSNLIKDVLRYMREAVLKNAPKRLAHRRSTVRRYSTSVLLVSEKCLWEFHPYVKRYRLLCLPPANAAAKCGAIAPHDAHRLLAWTRSAGTTVIWSLDLRLPSPQHAGQYLWRNEATLNSVSGGILFPKHLGESPNPVCLFRRCGDPPPIWRLLHATTSRTIKLLLPYNRISCALHASSAEESTDSFGMYVLGTDSAGRLILRDFAIDWSGRGIAAEHDEGSALLAQIPQEFSQRHGPAFSVFNDPDRDAPLLVGSAKADKKGALLVPLLRKVKGEPAWRSIAAPIADCESGKKLEGEYDGVVRGNTLTLWHAETAPGPRFFQRRRLCVDLSKGSTCWIRWTECAESAADGLRGPPVLSSKLPYTTSTLRGEARIVCDNAVSLSSREGFWLPQQELSKQHDIARLENVDWKTDYQFVLEGTITS